ncbi:hypothetical protein C8J57DRAFT_1248986 [Mycena rebaudengoi]|nr:hypothetical protein C8J57DRAFT_1248986 [Mycena rebaudengoi]
MRAKSFTRFRYDVRRVTEITAFCCLGSTTGEWGNLWDLRAGAWMAESGPGTMKPAFIIRTVPCNATYLPTHRKFDLSAVKTDNRLAPPRQPVAGQIEAAHQRLTATRCRCRSQKLVFWLHNRKLAARIRGNCQLGPIWELGGTSQPERYREPDPQNVSMGSRQLVFWRWIGIRIILTRLGPISANDGQLEAGELGALPTSRDDHVQLVTVYLSRRQFFSVDDASLLKITITAAELTRLRTVAFRWCVKMAVVEPSNGSNQMAPLAPMANDTNQVPCRNVTGLLSSGDTGSTFVDIGGGGDGYWLLVTGHYNDQLPLLFCYRGSSRKRWDTWWSGWSFVWSGRCSARTQLSNRFVSIVLIYDVCRPDVVLHLASVGPSLIRPHAPAPASTCDAVGVGWLFNGPPNKDGRRSHRVSFIWLRGFLCIISVLFFSETR